MAIDQATTHTLPTGGGELGELIRTKDWAQTILGPPDQWPQSLRTILSMLLHARFPMFLWWGPDLIQFYNDAYRPSLGRTGKHLTALGQRGADCWPETWPIIKPLIDQVLAGGEATWNEDQLIPIHRNGRIENVYWTFSYSPVWQETGLVGGVLVVCQDTTASVTRVREEQERFRFTLAAGRFGVWALDPATDMVHWDDRCAELFGLTGRAAVPYREALRSIHPDDVGWVDQTVRRSLDSQVGKPYDITYRTIGASDGRVRWVRFTGQALLNAQGELYRFGGWLRR